ncbi:putative cytochrome P450 [Septoria linicola]|nr:putative cytochrome P450 [Septoria linicola]
MQEFDRSIFFEQIFSTLAPQFHVHMPTGDDWKAHRKLVSETMSTRFLHDAAAPQMWSSAIALVELWKTKAKLAAGRPWDAADDVFKGALDIVWAAIFGADIGSTTAQAKFLERNGDLQLSSDIDEVVVFPTGEDPEDFTAILELGQSEEYAAGSLWPKMSHWLAVNCLPSLRRAVKRKDKMIAEQLRAAYNKLTQLQAQDKLDLNKHFRSALDLIVAKEVQMASREGRAVDVTNQVIRDELFGFIIAGHDTTSTFICWTLKFLTDNRDAQHKLYAALCSAFVGVTCGQSNARPVPSTTEISSTSIPYLEAVIEESGRLGLTSPATIRVTRCETEILGHRVPAGIDVFLSNAGPGCVSPLVGEVDDAKRSKGGMDQKQKWGMWDSEDIAQFRPERWLKEDQEGHVCCDRDAGPANAFGSGPRACFGKKWALLEIKIILTLIFWHFELQLTPAELSTHVAIDGVTHRPAQTYVRLKEVTE